MPTNNASGLTANIYGANTSEQPFHRNVNKNTDKAFKRNLDAEIRDKNIQEKGLSKAGDEDLYERLGIGFKEKQVDKRNNASEIGDFMKLFLAQLRCQDPLKPEEGADFVAQLAQFNSVEQLQKVNTGIQNIADSFRSNRILAATSMIGKQINVPTHKMQLTSFIEGDELKTEVVKGVMKIPLLDKGETISAFKMAIFNEKGEVVQGAELPLEKAKPGSEYPFTWSGTDKDNNRILDNNGHPIPDGNYKIAAQILVHGRSGGEWVPLETVIATKVNSVAINPEGEIEFGATGIGSLSLQELREITNADVDNTTAEKVRVPSIHESIIRAQQVAQARRDMVDAPAIAPEGGVDSN